MAKFGEKIRLERQRRGISLSQIAEATKISRRYLQALESGAFGDLPGGIFNKGYVRAYAQVVGLDEDATVQAYEAAESERAAASSEEGAAPGGAALSGLPPTAAPPEPRQRALHVAVALVALGGAALAAWVLFGGRDRTEPVTRAAPAPAAEPPRPAPDPSEAAGGPETDFAVAASGSVAVPEVVESIEAPPGPDRPAAPAAAAPAVETAAPSPTDRAAPAPRPAASELAVPDHGVGTGVAGHELRGRTDTFAPGDRVWFWTRVVGGAAGDRIRHVWIHDGREVETVELRVGGPHWRTHSVKTLHDAAVGDWTVEARDGSGTVLAREAFVRTGS